MALTGRTRELLDGVLEEARRVGYLGPGPVADHVEHALGFASVAGVDSDVAVDLGSGGGVPGLVLALWWPASRWVLLDASARRVAFLSEAARALGMDERVAAVHDRAESYGRVPTHRGEAELVTARSFGPPPVVAECAAPLLRVGGRAVVSEPPVPDATRWPVDGLSLLGLRPAPAGTSGPALAARYQVLEAISRCPGRFPRRVGIPTKRPLF